MFWFIIHLFGFFFSILELHFVVKIENGLVFENENLISENTCEVFMNDVVKEKCEINFSLQTKSNQNLENEKK